MPMLITGFHWLRAQPARGRTSHPAEYGIQSDVVLATSVHSNPGAIFVAVRALLRPTRTPGRSEKEGVTVANPAPPATFIFRTIGATTP
jgi:hypothetical protein